MLLPDFVLGCLALETLPVYGTGILCLFLVFALSNFIYLFSNLTLMIYFSPKGMTAPLI